MMQKRVKHMARDALTLGVAGVGLGTAGGLVMVGHGIGMLKEVVPKKKGRF